MRRAVLFFPRPLLILENVFDLDWNGAGISYGDVFRTAESQYSEYNFERADVNLLRRHFDDVEGECLSLLEAELPLPAYDNCIAASHFFNLLE